MPLRLEANRTLVKYKALRLITPERANELDIPAEAPVLVSPYINLRQACFECHQEYSPLLYQLGQQTTAQHFCKFSGGGIYTIDYSVMDRPDKWVSRRGLWMAQVIPHGPIRMGHDKGFTFHDVTPQKMLVPNCYVCNAPTIQGSLVQEGILSRVQYLGGDLVATCLGCVWATEWSYQITEDGQFHIHKPIPEGVRV